MNHLVAHYLAVWARLILVVKRPLVIGVTGSAGKTTTKEAIFHLLKALAKEGKLKGEIGASSGNLNSETGLPLAILRFKEAPETRLGWFGLMVWVPVQALLVLLSSYPRYLVLEYAADKPGDIAYLANLARPSLAVITAIGPAHLELFGTVRQVAKEKLSLVRAMPQGSPVIIHREVVLPRELEKTYRVTRVDGRGREVARRLACDVARALGVKLSEKQTERLFKDFELPPQRLTTFRCGDWWVIDDVYNANPLSMWLAFEELKLLGQQQAGRRVAILGDMLELGHEAPTYHREIGQAARRVADLVIGVGPLAQAYQGKYWYETSRTASREIEQFLKPRDIILVKGSRGMRMEEIVETLKRQANL